MTSRERLIQRNTTHGGRYSSEYSSWIEAKKRCHNPRSPRYADYGGRGIAVCDQWRTDFAEFLRAVGPKPSPHHQLDRYPDNDGHYEPGNVRWATPQEQAMNRRSNVYVDETRVVALLRAGLRPAAIGTLYGCSRVPIDAIARRRGLTFQPGGRRVKGQSLSPAPAAGSGAPLPGTIGR